jgi:hypothetical protein
MSSRPASSRCSAPLSRGAPISRVGRRDPGDSPLLQGCRKVRRGADFWRRGADPSTNASKLQQLTGRIASRSGTPHAETRTKALIPYGRARSAFQATEAGLSRRSVASAHPFGARAGSSRKGAIRRGFAGPPAVDMAGSSDRLEESKKIEKTGGSAFSTVQIEVACRLYPTRIGHRRSKSGGPCGTGGRLLWGSTLNPDPPAPEARTAIASCSVQPLRRLRREARRVVSFLEPCCRVATA